MQLVGELLPPSAWDLDAVHRTLVAQRQRVCPRGRRPRARIASCRSPPTPPRAQARVTVDAGAHMFPATMLWPVAEPNGMLISNGLSTMGFALPAAIGAALADRRGARRDSRSRRPVVALTGDGGLLMCAGELLTAVRERLRVIVIVFSDASLSLIDIKQRQRQPRVVRRGARRDRLVRRSPASFGAAAHRADDRAGARARPRAGAGAPRSDADRGADRSEHLRRNSAYNSRMTMRSRICWRRRCAPGARRWRPRPARSAARRGCWC